jgi:hypothetical protein
LKARKSLPCGQSKPRVFQRRFIKPRRKAPYAYLNLI